LPLLLVSLFAFSLDKPEPYRYTLLLTSGIALASFLITMSIKSPKKVFQEPKVGAEPKLKAVGFTAAVIGLIAIMSAIRFLQVAGLGTVSVYFNVYMDTELGLPPNVLGNISSLARFIAVGAVLLAPRLMRKSSTASVAFWASLATAFALVPIALVPNWMIAALGYICAIALTNLRFTAFLLYIMTIVPARQQAVMAGAGEMAAGFSFALMALGGGYIVTEYSFRELFVLGFLLTGLGSLIFWAYVTWVNSRHVALQDKPVVL
jgi:predicted MFS family arabinose efflux permease